jgi:hypothetical protein
LKVGKYLTGQNIKGSGVLPNPELFKTSVDVFSIHDGFISSITIFSNAMQHGDPIFQYSIIPIVSEAN